MNRKQGNIMKSKIFLCIEGFLLIISSLVFGSENYNDNWPSWRGPLVTGEALNGAPPIEWSETRNVKWKTPIPGKGLSTPVVWGDQIFITTAIELDQKATEEAIKRQKKKSNILMRTLGMSKRTKYFQQFVVYSINRNTGKINWEQIVREQYPHEGVQKNGSWASPSCITDGEHMIASFGSYGMYCFDMKGNLIWEKDLGDMHIAGTFGEGTSPVIYKHKLIIVWDHEEQSKIYVLDKNTGKEIWQKKRNEKTTWATPVVVELDKQIQIIVTGKTSMGYNLTNGEIVWQLDGLGGDIIPCPVFDGEMAFLMSADAIGSKKVQAINLTTAKGNLENSEALIWIQGKKAPYVPSPLLKDGKLYYLQGSSSKMTCTDAKTGQIYYDTEKANGMRSAYASPVAANGMIYIIDRNGLCSVIKEGAGFEVVAQNQLDDKFDASPAIVGSDLILRGLKNLYCISRE